MRFWMRSATTAFAVFAGFALLSQPINAADTVTLNGENTKVEFVGTKPDGSKHAGGFKKLVGKFLVDPQKMGFVVEFDCNSIYSDNIALTVHLKSADFFAVKKHPKARFLSKSITKTTTPDVYQVTGVLTLLGNQREITFPAKITHANGFTLAANLVIKRKEFGMTYGDGKIDDDVKISVKVDAK